MPNKMNVILLSCVYTLFLQYIICDQVQFYTNKTLQNLTFQVTNVNSSTLTYTHSGASNDGAPSPRSNEKNHTMSKSFVAINSLQNHTPQPILTTQNHVSEPLNNAMLDRHLLLNESSNNLRNKTDVLNFSMQHNSTFHSGLNKATPNVSLPIATQNVHDNREYKTMDTKVSASASTVTLTNALEEEEEEIEEIQIRSPLALVNGTMVDISSSRLNNLQKQAIVKEETTLKMLPKEAKSLSQEIQTLTTLPIIQEKTLSALSVPLQSDSKKVVSTSISHSTSFISGEPVASQYNNTKPFSIKKQVTSTNQESHKTSFNDVTNSLNAQSFNVSLTTQALSTLVHETYTTHAVTQQSQPPQSVLNNSLHSITKGQQSHTAIASVAAIPQDDVKLTLDSTKTIVQEYIPLTPSVQSPHQMSSIPAMSSNKPTFSNKSNEQNSLEKRVMLESPQKNVQQKKFANNHEGNIKSGTMRNSERFLEETVNSGIVNKYQEAQEGTGKTLQDAQQQSRETPQDAQQRSTETPQDAQQQSRETSQDAQQQSVKTPQNAQQQTRETPQNAQQQSRETSQDAQQQSRETSQDAQQQSVKTPQNAQQQSRETPPNAQQQSRGTPQDAQQQSVKKDQETNSHLKKQDLLYGWMTTNRVVTPVAKTLIKETSRVISPSFLRLAVDTVATMCKKISSELFWANVYLGSMTRMYFNNKVLGTLDFLQKSIPTDTNGWNHTLFHIITTSLVSCFFLCVLSSCGFNFLPNSFTKKSFQNDIKALAMAVSQLEKNFNKETKRSASVHERLLKAIDKDTCVFPTENQSTQGIKEDSRITDGYLKELLSYVKMSQEQNAANGEVLKNLLSLFDFLATTVTRLTRNVVNSETQWNENLGNTSLVRSSSESHETDVSGHNAETNQVSFLEQQKKSTERISHDSPSKPSTLGVTKISTEEECLPKKERPLATKTSNEEQENVSSKYTVATQPKTISDTMISNSTVPTAFTVDSSETSPYSARASHLETKGISKGDKVQHDGNSTEETTECSKNKLPSSQRVGETSHEKNHIQASHESSTVSHYHDSTLPSDPFATSSGSENFPAISFDGQSTKYPQTYNTLGALNDTAYRTNSTHGGSQEFNHGLWNHPSIPQQTIDHTITSSQEHRDVSFLPLNHVTNNNALPASEPYSLQYERHPLDRSHMSFPDHPIDPPNNITGDSSYSLGSLQFNSHDYRMNYNKPIQQPVSLMNARSNMQTYTPSKRLEDHNSMMVSHVNPTRTAEDSNIPFSANQMNATPFLQNTNQERKIVSWASLSQQAKYKTQAKRRPVPQPLKGISDPFAM